MPIAALLTRLFRKSYRSVDPQQAAALIADGAILLDVREPAEWRAGHAPKARHIPLGQLTDRLTEIPADRPVITVCRSGARSRQAAALLARQGRQVHNLTGGMHAWTGAGMALRANGGRPGRVA